MVFQELSKSKYVQVVGDSQFTPCNHHNDDDDDSMAQPPVIHARSDDKPMVADKTRYDQTIYPSSECGCTSPCQDLVDAPEPPFDSDDVPMDRSLDIVPRRFERFFKWGSKMPCLLYHGVTILKLWFRLQHQTPS